MHRFHSQIHSTSTLPQSQSALKYFDKNTLVCISLNLPRPANLSYGFAFPKREQKLSVKFAEKHIGHGISGELLTEYPSHNAGHPWTLSCTQPHGVWWSASGVIPLAVRWGMLCSMNNRTGTGTTHTALIMCSLPLSLPSAFHLEECFF